MIPFARRAAAGGLASTAVRGGLVAPPRLAPTADELADIAADLAAAAEGLVAAADALVEAPPDQRTDQQAALYRWHTVLRLGARRLRQAGDLTPLPPFPVKEGGSSG